MAILLVLAAHLIGTPMPEGSFVEQSIKHVAGYGGLGVDLFFGLPEFLITGILLDSRASASHFKNFYIHRALRIFPLHYASVLILLFVLPLVMPGLRDDLRPTVEHQAWVWLDAINIKNALSANISLPYVDHYWSLGVEEHFYFVWPLLVRALSTRALRTIAAVTSLVAAIGGGINPIAVYVLTPFRSICCAEVPSSQSSSVHARRTRSASSGHRLGHHRRRRRAAVDMGRDFRSIGMHELIAALLAYVVVSDPRSTIRRFFEAREMVFFGKYSYGLHVIHAILGAYAMNHQTRTVAGEAPPLGCSRGLRLLRASPCRVHSTCPPQLSFDGKAFSRIGTALSFGSVDFYSARAFTRSASNALVHHPE